MIDERLIRDISDKDAMFVGHEGHYFDVGRSALAVIETARRLAGRPEPARVLDLPCGHGRVTRFLRAAYPAADITVCDIDRDGVDFCRDTFGCTAAYGDEDFTRVGFSAPFDLIWVGSLITHLPAARTAAFLAYAADLLAPDGLLVVTYHGRFVAGRIDHVPYGIAGADIPGMLADWSVAGYGYADYPDRSGYGISLCRSEWVLERLSGAGLSVALLSERRWDGHHDVVAGQRTA